MKKAYITKLASILIIGSLSFTGCGSNSNSTNLSSSEGTNFSGVALDPELQGATVFLDENENGVLDNGELNTTTDSNGRYSLTISDDLIGKPIIVYGGVDRVTKEDFTGQLSVITEDNNETTNITPLTTLVEKYQSAFSDLNLTQVEEKLMTKLDLNSSESLGDNFIEKNNKKMLKLALQINSVAQIIADQNSSTDISKVYGQIASNLDDNNYTASLDIVTANIPRARALHKTLSILDENNVTTDELALIIDNIDQNISDTSLADLNITDLYMHNLNNNHRNSIKGNGEKEKAKRTIKYLGMDSLDSNQTHYIETKLLDNNMDFDKNITELRDEMLKNNNDFDFNTSMITDMKKENFMHETFDGLDINSTNELKAKLDNEHFDFENNDISSFKDEIFSNNFFDADESSLKTKIDNKRRGDH